MNGVLLRIPSDSNSSPCKTLKGNRKFVLMFKRSYHHVVFNDRYRIAERLLKPDFDLASAHKHYINIMQTKLLHFSKKNNQVSST